MSLRSVNAEEKEEAGKGCLLIKRLFRI